MKEKTRICVYTKWSKKFKQNNLLTIVKEWYIEKEVTFAKILFEI